MQQLLSNASQPNIRITNNRPGKVTDGIVLLYYSAIPYVAHGFQDQLK